MKKLIVFLGSALISLRPSVRDFYCVKKKLLKVSNFFYFTSAGAAAAQSEAQRQQTNTN